MSARQRGLAFDKDNEKRLDVRPFHREHLHVLLAEGKLVMAGPWQDDSGALLIFDVTDEREMHEVLGNDPYLRADVVSVVSVRQWTPILPE